MEGSHPDVLLVGLYIIEKAAEACRILESVVSMTDPVCHPYCPVFLPDRVLHPSYGLGFIYRFPKSILSCSGAASSCFRDFEYLLIL